MPRFHEWKRTPHLLSCYVILFGVWIVIGTIFVFFFLCEPVYMCKPLPLWQIIVGRILQVVGLIVVPVVGYAATRLVLRNEQRRHSSTISRRSSTAV